MADKIPDIGKNLDPRTHPVQKYMIATIVNEHVLKRHSLFTSIIFSEFDLPFDSLPVRWIDFI